MLRARNLCRLALTSACLTGVASADVILSGDYDSLTTNPNQVDKSATGTGSITVDAFDVLIAAGFTNQTAGVLTFDTGANNSGINTASFSNARFDDVATGDVLFKIQRTVAGSNTQVETDGNNRTPISGNGGFGGQQAFGFLFDPADGIVVVGLTMISRGGASDGTGTFTATFADPDGNNPVTLSLSASIASVDGTDDTFFGLEAPAGKFLQSISVQQAQFSWIDDLGVSTVVPEPAALGLSAAGLAVLAGRRRH